MEIRAMAKRFQSAEKDSYWRWHVDMQAAGGVSVRAYCGQHGLSEPTFYVWRRKIQESDSGRDRLPVSRLQNLSPRSATRAAIRSEQTDGREAPSAANERLSVRSKVDPLRPFAGTGLIGLDIIDTATPSLEIEAPGGVVIRLREDVSVEVLRRVIAACQLSHSTAAARSQERSC
jgi:transposase-like protein